jgi:regulator of protease activity HflC (stomatin/prohibitin superfamily)
MKRFLAVVAVLVVLYQILFLPVFINTADKYAVIAKGEEVIRVVDRAGVYFTCTGPGKRLVYLDKGILEFTAEPSEIITGDGKSVTLTYSIRWQITDAADFYRAVENRESAEERIDDIVYFELRQKLVEYDYADLDAQTYRTVLKERVSSCADRTAGFAVTVRGIEILKAALTPEGEELKNLRHLPYL